MRFPVRGIAALVFLTAIQARAGAQDAPVLGAGFDPTPVELQPVASGAARRPMTSMALLTIRDLYGMQIAPDGKSVAFVVGQAIYGTDSVVLSPGRGGQTAAAGAAGTRTLPTPSQPTFLDEPTRGAVFPSDSTPVGILSRPPSHTTPDRQGLPRRYTGSVREAAGEPVAPSGRLQAFEAALKSPVLAMSMGRTAGTDQSTNEGSEARLGTASAEERLL